ncbi:MAG TPA: GNAT family N-acetyltransferase [Caproicibacter sp.]|nr:GNAT family N-acetyltransferase [Caproicibacter sp.]
MILRKLRESDKETYIAMSKDFYHSDAVLGPIPGGNFEKTFQVLLSGSPFADAYIAEKDGAAAGYILLAVTWSNEAGGMAVWLEEIYVRPEFRNTGLGGQMIREVLEKYGEKTARFRLEIEDSNTGAKRLYKRIGFEELPYRQMIYKNK